jgi:hypothetical protein
MPVCSIRRHFAIFSCISRSRICFEQYETRNRLLRMEFQTFLQTVIQIPAQIVRTSRKLIYRLLTFRSSAEIVFLLFDDLEIRAARGSGGTVGWATFVLPSICRNANYTGPVSPPLGFTAAGGRYRNRSTIVKRPAVAPGSVGIQPGFILRKLSESACNRPTKTSARIVLPTGPSSSPRWNVSDSFKM